MTNGYPCHVVETVDQIISRIDPFIPTEVGSISQRVTGSLLELNVWWEQRATGMVKPLEIHCPNNANLAAGIATANSAIDSGHNLIFLTEPQRKNSQLARALIGLLTRKDAYCVFFHEKGVNDRAAMESMGEIRDLMREHSDARGEPLRLAALDPSIDFTVGLLLSCSARKTPVITGTNENLAGALIAQRLSMKASSWWRHGSTSPDAATNAAVDRMGIPPGLPLNLSDDLGVGAQISVTLLQEFIEI